MKEITLTINGQKVKGKEGDTILAVCKANNIFVPTLCHLDGLSDIGACRLCVVEIEGERRINPACTYPARDGLVVRTATEKLEKHRRMTLELMFTEKNHLCAFCAASGDCELQSLAYRYQLDHVRYAYSWPPLPVDSVNEYVVIDHNRCILCGRCIRTCDEIVANHTLDFGRRGYRTTVCADLNQSLGESTCISCGACAQACPTGAIFTKPSLYKGRKHECSLSATTCTECGVGCDINVFARGSNLVRIESSDLSSPRGALCSKGRFVQLSEKYDRILSPAIRNSKGELQEATWEDALARVARRFGELKKRYGPQAIAGAVSSRHSNESLMQYHTFMTQAVGTARVDTLDGESFRTIERGITAYDNKAGLDIESPLEEILKADCVMVMGGAPLTTHPVVGSFILKATRQNKAFLITVDRRPNPFPYRTPLQLRPTRGAKGLVAKGLLATVIQKSLGHANTILPEPVVSDLKAIDLRQLSAEAGVHLEDIERAATAIATAKHAVIIYGHEVLEGKADTVITNLLRLAAVTGNSSSGRLHVIGLMPPGNSRGAWNIGLAHSRKTAAVQTAGEKVRGAYLMLGDDSVQDTDFVGTWSRVGFLAVSAAFKSPLTDKADVVFPALVWAEREGTYTTMDGIKKTIKPAVPPPSSAREDWQILKDLSPRLLEVTHAKRSFRSNH